MAKRMTGLMLVVAALFLIAAAGPARAVDIPGRVSLTGVSHSSSASLLGTTARVTLTSADDACSTSSSASRRYEAFVGSDGGFTLRGVAPGAYLAEVCSSAASAAAAERVEVRDDGTVKGRVWDARRARLALPLDGAAPAAYFAVRPRFDPLALLRNPMVLMMGFSALMIFVLPRLQANMDPDELRQLQAENKLLLADGSVVLRDALIPRWAPPLPRRLGSK